MRHALKLLAPAIAAMFVVIVLVPAAGGATTMEAAVDFTGNTHPDFAAVVAAPEPSTIALAVLGGIGIFLLRRRKA